MTNYTELYDKLYYTFKNEELLTKALSHPSLSYSKNNKNVNYERLELLGDSVLSLIILEMLLVKYPDLNEGEIAKRKSNLVCTDALSKIGFEIDIGKYIYMTKGEENLNGRNNPKILENVIESIIAALYLDGGLDAAKNFIKIYWTELIDKQRDIKKDPKTRLQEWLQKNKYNIPIYNVIGQEGLESNPIFIIQVEADNLPKFEAKNTTKKGGEVDCAIQLIEYIRKNIDDLI